MYSREKPSEGEVHVWVFSGTTLLIYTNQKHTSLSLATGNYIKYLSLCEGVVRYGTISQLTTNKPNQGNW